MSDVHSFIRFDTFSLTANAPVTMGNITQLQPVNGKVRARRDITLNPRTIEAASGFNYGSNNITFTAAVKDVYNNPAQETKNLWSCYCR